MMNGIEAILAQIREDAEQQAAELTADSKRQAAELLAEGERQAGEEAGAVTAAGRARADTILEKARQDAAIEGRKRVAAEKQKMLDSTFNRALTALLDLPEAEYVALLSDLVVSACADGQGGELLFSSRDRERIGAAVLDRVSKRLPDIHLTLAQDNAPIQGGVVVRRGRVELNCALEILVRMQAEECSAEVLHVLFSDGA